MSAGHHNMVAGVRQAMKAIDAGKAEIVYLADDADCFVAVPITDTCREKGVRIESVPTKTALGRMCRIDVPSAVAVKLKE